MKRKRALQPRLWRSWTDAQLSWANLSTSQLRMSGFVQQWQEEVSYCGTKAIRSTIWSLTHGIWGHRMFWSHETRAKMDRVRSNKFIRGLEKKNQKVSLYMCKTGGNESQRSRVLFPTSEAYFWDKYQHRKVCVPLGLLSWNRWRELGWSPPIMWQSVFPGHSWRGELWYLYLFPHTMDCSRSLCE